VRRSRGPVSAGGVVLLSIEGLRDGCGLNSFALNGSSI
jgi:hypothetical protein